MATTQIVSHGHTYSATISRGPQDTTTRVSIACDGHWAGDGTLRVVDDSHLRIEDCAAELVHGDADATDAVYAELEAAIVDMLARGVGAEADPFGESESFSE